MNQFKTRSLLFVFSIAVLLFGCHKDNDTTSSAILTLRVDAFYQVDADNWIFATNDAGEILDAKPYTAGATVELVSDKAGDKINVTFFNRKALIGASNSFVTYADVLRGTTLHLENTNAPAPTGQTGQATFMISNFDSSNGLAMEFSNGHSVSLNNSKSSSETDVDVFFYGVPSDFTLTAYRDGVPMYNLVQGVKNGDVIKRDFDVDFLPFPHQRKLDFEGQTYAYLYGLDAKSNYVAVLGTSQLAGTPYEQQPVIGYLDGFASYEMKISNKKSNGTVVYQTSGEPDLSFAMPAFTFALNSNGMRDLSFTFSEDYTWYFSTWSYYTDEMDYVSWTFNAPAGTLVKGLAVPDEIAAKYPEIDLSKFEHTGISFTKITEGGSYLESVLGATVVGDHKTVKKYTYTPDL